MSWFSALQDLQEQAKVALEEVGSGAGRWAFAVLAGGGPIPK